MTRFELSVSALFANVLNAIRYNLGTMLKASFTLTGFYFLLIVAGMVLVGDSLQTLSAELSAAVEGGQGMNEQQLADLLARHITAGQAGLIVGMVSFAAIITWLVIDTLTTMLAAQAVGDKGKAPGPSFMLVKLRVFACMGLGFGLLFLRAFVDVIEKALSSMLGGGPAQLVIGMILLAVVSSFVASAAPAMYLERLGPVQAIKRSFKLGSTGFATVFRYWLALYLGAMGAVLVVVLLLSMLGVFASALGSFFNVVLAVAVITGTLLLVPPATQSSGRPCPGQSHSLTPATHHPDHCA